MRQCNGGRLLDSMQLTIMDNKEVYAGLSPADVRSHFRRWREQAVAQEQERTACNGAFFAPRYAYCVQIDSGALHSILNQADTTSPSAGGIGYAHVISAIEGHETGARPEYYEELNDANFDTGWMRVAYQELLQFAWYWVGDVNAWYSEYLPPPRIHNG